MKVGGGFPIYIYIEVLRRGRGEGVGCVWRGGERVCNPCMHQISQIAMKIYFC